MKFKIDENLPIDVAVILRQEGYDAKTVSEQNLVGQSDSIIAQICRKEKRTLITLDTDFSDIRSYPPKEYNGIIVLRLARQDKFYVLRIINNLLKVFVDEVPEGCLWIVEEEKIRIRSEK